MSIATVQATINGSTYNLTYDGTAGQWTATLTAPGATSYNLANGYYPVVVTATNDAGTQASATVQLVVKERVAPVIAILSPSSGAYVTNSQQPIVINVTDEAGGSGVDLTTLLVKLDGAAVTDYTTTAIANGYSVTVTPPTMTDGSHTVTVDIQDHDGNAATQKSVTFAVDTVPPTLNITSPTEGIVTAAASLTVAGTTNDSASSPVTVTVTLNGVDQGAVTIGGDGTFAKIVTLTEGSNIIVVTATDAAGQTSTVTRTVTLDTSTPVIQSATVTPNPVDAGATMIITVVIT